MYTMSVDTVDGTTYESDAEEFSAEELDRLTDILNDNLADWSTVTIKSNGMPVVILVNKIVAVYFTEENV